MFKKSGKKKPAPSAKNVTVINKGTVVEGEVKVDGTIRVYGQLNGTVHSEGKVIIAEAGHLSGDLYAEHADVSGTVEGVIKSTRLDLRSTATVEGNVVVEKFTTETGAIFMGECKMPQGGVMPGADTPPDAADGESPSHATTEEKAAAEDPAGDVPTPDDAADEVAPAAVNEAEPSSDGASEPVEPVATPVEADNGVRPLPNKPQEEATPEPIDDGDDQDARPRFW